MIELIAKYNLLEPVSKIELLKFLDSLLSKQKTKTSFDMAAYKKNILQVSTWEEEDLKVFDDNQKRFNEWQVPKW